MLVDVLHVFMILLVCFLMFFILFIRFLHFFMGFLDFSIEIFPSFFLLIHVHRFSICFCTNSLVFFTGLGMIKHTNTYDRQMAKQTTEKYQVVLRTDKKGKIK